MAGKHGGAWKVAYADFVTAMMAFFLVMWIAGQDQKIKRAVSTYFSDPFSESPIGNSKKPASSGSVTASVNNGKVPDSESLALGRGRNSYSMPIDKSLSTKLVSDWLHSDELARKYWRGQAQIQRDKVRKAKADPDEAAEIEKQVIRQLADQLKEEFTRDIRPQVIGLYRELMFEIIADVNWLEIAEDLYRHSDE